MNAANNAALRRENKRRILGCIRKTPLSRAQLAQKLKLTRAAVTYIADELLKDGYLTESFPKSKARGRHPVLLHIKPNRLYFGGIDVRREGIVAGVVNLAGEEIVSFFDSYGNIPPPEHLRQIAGKLLKQSIPLTSIGVTAPGPLDIRSGVILNPPNFEAWHNVPIADILGKGTGLPVVLQNIAEAVALEEYYFNGMETCHALLALLVDSGIGSGIIIDGHTVNGSELGHTSIVLNGRPCACGNFGCLERYASMPDLLSETPYPTWVALMHAQDPAAVALVEKEAVYLSQAIVNAVNILRVERVVLRGDIAYNSGRLCELINERVIARAVTALYAREPVVSASALPTSLRTAAMPAIHRYFEE